MNASEGGVDKVMRFTDSDDFVRWLIGATVPTSTVEQITHSINKLREHAAARPHWQNELDLWNRVVDPLLDLAVAHEQVAARRAELRTAQVNATAMLADADATIAALGTEQEAASERYDRHDQMRRDASATLRRAQAHRLRIQLRAAELRVEDAERESGERRIEHNEAKRNHAAWRLVGDVLAAAKTASELAGLEERRDAAEKETAQLRQELSRRRHALARVLTARRDAAESALREARDLCEHTEDECSDVEGQLQSKLSEQATAAEQLRRLEEDVENAEQVIADAVTSGTLDEGADPAELDGTLAKNIINATAERKVAVKTLRDIATEVSATEQARATAHSRASINREAGRIAERELRSVRSRIDALISDERLLDVAGDVSTGLWSERTALQDALRRRAESADTDKAQARRDVDAAERMIASIDDQGLLPPLPLVEDAVSRCVQAEIPAWSGWRWLADTMPGDQAAAFAEKRPDIASGVIVSHPAHLDRAVEEISDLHLDAALWVGAVTDPEAAAARSDSGTTAHVLVPPPGMFDRFAAAQLIAAANEDRDEALQRLGIADGHGRDARAVLAALEQLWLDLPEDPRQDLEGRITSAGERVAQADTDEQKARDKLSELDQRRVHWEQRRSSAQEVVDAATERRRLLVPVIAADVTIQAARNRLPGLRETVTTLNSRIGTLRDRLPKLRTKVEDVRKAVETRARARDDARDELRSASLSPTREGPVPTEDAEAIRARIDGVRHALDDASVDPALGEEIDRLQRMISDIEATLDADAELRDMAKELAATDGARHHVALTESIRAAGERESTAGHTNAVAEAAAKSLRQEYQRRVDDRTDRSSPDVDGYPPAATMTSADDADRYADRLDHLADELNEKQRTEGKRAADAKEEARQKEVATRLVTTSAKQLRHLASTELSGRHVDDVDELIERLDEYAERVRVTQLALNEANQNQQRMCDVIRGNANGTSARKVEDRQDPRIVDLIHRLRADRELPVDAERLAEQLEQRVATLQDDLNQYEERVRTCAKMLHVQAATALEKLRHYQNQSLLPEGLGDWSLRKFVVIDHEKIPADESVALDRVARIVNGQLSSGVDRSDATQMLSAAAHALVDAPFRVRLLKPHTDMSLDRVDVSELKNFSGGQRVTAGVLLYATMAKVRAAGDATSIGWLWLDNPFGQASADQFVRTMRRAADKLGLQLVFTAAPQDKGALSMFDRITALAKRSRPSSGEKVVLVDTGTQEIADLTLVQEDVLAVLGE